MLPPLPKFDQNRVWAVFGSYLNQIRSRIYRQTLISSPTIKVSETDRGQQLDRVGGAGSASALPLGFGVTHTGASVVVAAGRVLTPSWSGATGNDFKPSNWTTETNFSGTTLSSSATTVWLQVQFTESDTESEGLLGTVTYDLSGGAGGRGGGGAGGGAANADPSIHYVTGGAGGADGDAGGAGGAGGGVFKISDDTVVATTGGYGGDGGDGGNGGDGADGTSATFTRHTKAVAQVRHYTISGISAHTTKGTASETAAWIKLATITGTSVVQHHIGSLKLTPAVVCYVES
jgi:hypothetical protein